MLERLPELAERGGNRDPNPEVHAPALPKPGDFVDRFAVIAEVARGGMAAVFAVRRSGLGGFDKVLALKVVLPHLAGERQALERFLDEARIASRITHPSVVQVLDVGEHAGLPYLVMEFLRGRSLAQVARKAKELGRTLSLGFRLAVLARAAEGLAAAHRTRGPDGQLLGIVHRDVSPQNIHVGYDGEVKVVDFGIAAAQGRLADTRSGEFRGKLSYAAPEQMQRGDAIDARTDTWALGVVAWELLARARLFRGEDDAQTIYNVLHLPVPELRARCHELPAEAAEWVMRCLERERKRRPGDLDQLAEVLDRAAAVQGGGRRSDVAREMNELFQAERMIEEERLTAAQRGSQFPAYQLEPGGGSLTALSKVSRTRFRAPITLGVMLVAVAGVGAVLGARKLGFWPDTAASTQAEPATAPSKRIGITIPAETRLALVDDKRHDERPLSIELTAGGSAKLTLVMQNGDTIERQLTQKDDGLIVQAPALEPSAPAASASSAVAEQAPRPKTGPSRPAKPTSTATKKPSTPLLDDPY